MRAAAAGGFVFAPEPVVDKPSEEEGSFNLSSERVYDFKLPQSETPRRETGPCSECGGLHVEMA